MLKIRLHVRHSCHAGVAILGIDAGTSHQCGDERGGSPYHRVQRLRRNLDGKRRRCGRRSRHGPASARQQGRRRGRDRQQWRRRLCCGPASARSRIPCHRASDRPQGRHRGGRRRGRAAMAGANGDRSVRSGRRPDSSPRHRRCAMRRWPRPAARRRRAGRRHGDEWGRGPSHWGGPAEGYQWHDRGGLEGGRERESDRHLLSQEARAFTAARPQSLRAGSACADRHQGRPPRRHSTDDVRKRPDAVGRQVPGSDRTRPQIQPRPCRGGVGGQGAYRGGTAPPPPAPPRRPPPGVAALAALAGGAGLVTLATPRDALDINAAASLAVMVRPIDGATEFAAMLADPRFNAAAIGPGAGVGLHTREMTLAALAGPRSVVIDADALTSFADDANVLFAALNKSRSAVLTPHSGEFHRLFDKSLESSPAAFASKLSATRAAAGIAGAVVVHKGADTVIAAPDGRAAINANAPPWLATAGTGDVLAGLITGLVAQGMPTFQGAPPAVWVPGEAAAAAGPGMISEDLAPRFGEVYRRLFSDICIS